MVRYRKIVKVKPFNLKDEVEYKPKPQPLIQPNPIVEPQIQPPQQIIQTIQEGNLKEQLTQRFIRGEITETAYLTALKSLENTDTPIGYI